MKCFAFAAVVVAGLTCALACRAEGAPQADPAQGFYTLKLASAAPNDRAVTVYLETKDGKPTVALARGLNGVTYDVDCSKLALDGGALKGELTFDVTFDGYVPPPGQQLSCAYTLDAKVNGGQVAGTFTGLYDATGAKQKMAGALSGTLAPKPTLAGLQFLQLHMENAIHEGKLGKGSWGSRGFPSFVLKDGKVLQALVWGHGGRAQINYLEGDVIKSELAWGENALTGPFTVRTTEKPTDPAKALNPEGETYEYLLKLKVVGNQLAGTYIKKLEGREVPSGPVCGTFAPYPVLPADNAVYYLQFFKAVGGGRQLMSFVPCVKGQFAEGMAYSGRWNHTYHDVDAAGLKLDGDTLKGLVKATMNPDPYVPADKKPVSCEYHMDAKVHDGLVEGQYQGKFGAEPVSGAVLGRLEENPSLPEPVSINIKLDDGVCGGAPWFRRCYVGFTAVKGEADKGGVSNNKGGWKGTFKHAAIKFDGATFTATIEMTVDTTSGPLVGKYRFEVTGKVIGGVLIGKADTYLEGELKKQGTAVMGGFGAGKN